MKHNILLVVTLLYCAAISLAQPAPDFTINSAQGSTHSLHSDYLDQGKFVVLKFFFSSCPPCNSTAPAVQALYDQWGAGSGDVEFVALTTQTWDNNSGVINYVNQHSLTFPAAGADGNGEVAARPYKQGDYGPFFGTPSYAIVHPDRTVEYPVFFNQLDSRLTELTSNVAPQPTSVNIQMTAAKNGLPITVEGLSLTLKPANASSPAIDLIAATNGTLQFEYPSPDFPEMNDPVIVASSSAGALTADITSLDLVTMQRHILQLNPIGDQARLIASDLNNNGSVTGADVVALRKVLLQIEDDFPSVPSYLFTPSQLPVTPNPGQTVSISFEVIKMGDASLN